MTSLRRCLQTLLSLLLLLLAMAGAEAAAAQRALLVGVSELVNQPQALWLQAPRNDVLLMRQVLLKQGFAPNDITVLADGVAGAALPESQRIHEALSSLLAQSQSGDFVLLYFSGHGTRLRDSTKQYQEPDGLAENFLARDVRGAVGTSAALSGGVRDVDFDGWVQAFLARNVFVWSVFDTCSATSMTRRAGAEPVTAEGPPDDEVRWRGLRSTQLRPSAEVVVPPRRTPPPQLAVPRARYVAFFASESHQVTPELRLPRSGRSGRPQGLLTWAVANALDRHPSTWRDLFDGVLAAYPPVIDELAQRFPQRELPSPVAEGNLDAPIFANSAASASTRPVWRAERAGGMLTLQAGTLDGLVPQQTVRVNATLEDGTVRTAQARLEQVDLGSARMAVPVSLRELSGAALWNGTAIEEPPSLALRVRGDRALLSGLSLEYPASIVVVERADAEVDVRLIDAGGGAQRMQVLSAAPGELASAGWTVPSIEVRRQLETLARLKWFMQLHSLGRDLDLDGFDATFEVWTADRMLRNTPVQSAAGVLPLRSGERAVLHVRNTSGRSLNLVVVGIDREGVRPVYPGDAGESNRFERGTREAAASKRFDLPWFGVSDARLLVLATPASVYSAPRLFGANVTEGRSDVRVRGQLRPEPERQFFSAMVR